jgi:hypothetical protein
VDREEERDNARQGRDHHDLVHGISDATGDAGRNGRNSGSGGAILFTTVGFLLFLSAKLSLITKGVYVSCGSRKMSPRFRVCYRCGYERMLMGVMAAIGAVVLGF